MSQTTLSSSAPQAAGKPTRRPITVIQPTRSWLGLNLRELWAYRDLLFILAGRTLHYMKN